jgi:hypothetical protein
MTVNRSLIGYPSHLSGASFAMITGAADADFPVANLADLKRIRRVFKASASGGIAFSCELAADHSVEFVGLLHHNGTNGTSYRIRCYSDAGMTTLVDDSGSLSFSISADALFPAVTPYALPSPQTVRAVRVDLGNTGVAWQIGALEVSGLWDFEPVAKRELGISPNDEVSRHADGASHATRLFSPRVVGSGRELITAATDGATFRDFLKANGRSEPFVWTRAYEDAASWQREAILMRNASLPQLSRQASTLADFDLAFVEHLR